MTLEELAHLALRTRNVAGLLLLGEGTGVFEFLGGELLVELIIELAGLPELLLQRLTLQAPSILAAALGLLGAVAFEDQTVELGLLQAGRQGGREAQG